MAKQTSTGYGVGEARIKLANPVLWLPLDPTSNDVSFDIGQVWINKITRRAFLLVSLAGGVAVWQFFNPVFPLTVPDGGTGDTDLSPAHGVLIGEGVNPINVTATGSAGQIFQSSGALADPVYSTATYPSTTLQGDLLLSSSNDTITALTKDINATRYLSNTGLNNNAAWAQVDLSNGVTSTLTVPNGGTGQLSLTDHGVVLGQGVNPVAVTAPGVAHSVFMGTLATTDPAFTITGTPYVTSISFDAGTNSLAQFIDTTTFTPTIVGSTGAGTATYTEQSGRYMVIGNWVLFNINLAWHTHTGTGDMTITGFPFKFAAAQSFYPNVCMMQNIALPANTKWVVIDGVNNAQTAEVTASLDNAAFAQVQMSAAGSLHVQGFYPGVAP